MPRAQFRDVVVMRGTSGVLMVAPPGTSVALYDIGTSNPIAEAIYAAEGGSQMLPNPLYPSVDGSIEFWLAEERELDLVASCPGLTTVRATVTTDGISPVGAGVVGPPGAQGPQGPVGPQGPSGSPGATGQGVPAGGTVSQVLTKNTATDYDTAWATPTAPSTGGDKLLLNYSASADVGASIAMAANTWTNIGPQLSFTTDSATAAVEIALSIGAWCGPTAAGTPVIGGGVLIDGTTRYNWGGSTATSSAYNSPFAGGGPIAVTGLSVGTHTLQVQARSSQASVLGCQPATYPQSSFIVRVWQRGA